MGSESEHPQMFRHQKDAFERASGGSGDVASFKLELFYWTSAWSSCAGLCLQFPLVSVVSLVQWLMSAADVAQL